MFRRALLLSFLAFVSVSAVQPRLSGAAPLARYTVQYRKPTSGVWQYHGQYDLAAAHRVARQLKAQGFAVSMRSASTAAVVPRPAIRQGNLNRGRFPAERALLLKSGGFPQLGHDFEVLAPHTGVYNCIAWSMGITDHWVWPGSSLSAFDREYGQLGYRRLGVLDYRKQAGVAKIALYGHVKANGFVECTHAARQAPDGTWTSKLGQLPLIRHRTPNALNGPSYGRPIAVYVRSSG